MSLFARTKSYQKKLWLYRKIKMREKTDFSPLILTVSLQMMEVTGASPPLSQITRFYSDIRNLSTTMKSLKVVCCKVGKLTSVKCQCYSVKLLHHLPTTVMNSNPAWIVLTNTYKHQKNTAMKHVKLEKQPDHKSLHIRKNITLILLIVVLSILCFINKKVFYINHIMISKCSKFSVWIHRWHVWISSLVKFFAWILGMFKQKWAWRKLVSVHLLEPSHFVHQFVSAEAVHKAEGTCKSKTLYQISFTAQCCRILENASITTTRSLGVHEDTPHKPLYAFAEHSTQGKVLCSFSVTGWFSFLFY